MCNLDPITADRRRVSQRVGRPRADRFRRRNLPPKPCRPSKPFWMPGARRRGTTPHPVSAQDELLNRLRAATHGGSTAPPPTGSPCEKWASVRPIVVEIVSMLRGLASLSPVLGKAADVLDSLAGSGRPALRDGGSGLIGEPCDGVSVRSLCPPAQRAAGPMRSRSGRKKGPLHRHGPRLSLPQLHHAGDARTAAFLRLHGGRFDRLAKCT